MAARPDKTASMQGGVLSDATICQLVEHPPAGRQALIERWDKRNLRAARYDVRVAEDGCRTPDGRSIDADGGEHLDGPLVLHPGDSAWLSTHERFCLPPDVAGSVTLKTDLANSGLLLLSGVLIDPGYGMSVGGSTTGDRRLHFFVANFGAEVIALQPAPHPRATAIASVQFLGVVGPRRRKRALPAPSGPPTTGLGFVESLQSLRDDYGKLSDQVHRTRDLLRNLIVLGYFVLGTAVLSASLATILAIATNDDLVAATHKIVPHTVTGKLLLAVLVVSAAWIFYSMALLFGPRQELAPDLPSVQRNLREVVIRRLRARSALAGFSILLAVPPLAALAAWLVPGRWLADHSWPVWALIVSVAAGAMLFVRHDLQAPLTEWEIRQEMNRYGSTTTGASRIRNSVRMLRRLLGTTAP